MPNEPASVYELDKATLQLAVELADETARSDIELYSLPEMVGDEIWNNIDATPADMQQHADDRALARSMLTRALAYIALRGVASLPYQIDRHPDKPHLIMFRSRP